MFFLYYFFYGTSFAKVPWVYNSEVNSLDWRVRGAAAATATNWMGGFIVTQFTKVGVDNLRWKFYLSMSSHPCPPCPPFFHPGFPYRMKQRRNKKERRGKLTSGLRQ